MLKDTVSIDVQGFFENYIYNFILKEVGIVFKKDPNLNNSFLIKSPYDFTLINTKKYKSFLKRWRKQSRQLINIEEMGCPSLNRFKGNRFPYCESHPKGGVCALNNAYIILTFFKSSFKAIK